MNIKLKFLLSCLLVPFCAFGQGVGRHATLSRDPLTDDQIAVYRAVLKGYMKDSSGALNIAAKTKPLNLDDSSINMECLKGINMGLPPGTTPVIHKLTSAIAIGPRMVLVDPDQQEAKVKENDPHNLINKTINDHEKITDRQLDRSVKEAFASGLFSFSEIAFDKKQMHAVVSYSFVCGGLCGHGSTLVLEKVGDKWKIKKTCGDWIS